MEKEACCSIQKVVIGRQSVFLLNTLFLESVLREAVVHGRQ